MPRIARIGEGLHLIRAFQTRDARRYSRLGRGTVFSLKQNLIRAAVGFALLATFLPEFFSTSAQQFGMSQYRAKANILAAFPEFIDWPEVFPIGLARVRCGGD